VKLLEVPSAVSFVTMVAVAVIAGCGGSEADPESPKTEATQRAEPGGTVNLVSKEGHKYSVRYDSFKQVTNTVPPPNVNFAIRVTYTNVDDRVFALSSVMPDGRDTEVTLTIPRAAFPKDDSDPCDPTIPHDATHCTILGRVDGDTYANLAPGASGKATIRAYASEFASSISRADVVVKFGEKELPSEG
jgi:hypothetical protein